MKDEYLLLYEKDLKWLSQKKKKLLKELEDIETEKDKIRGYCREILGRETA